MAFLKNSNLVGYFFVWMYCFNNIIKIQIILNFICLGFTKLIRKAPAF